MGQRSHDFHDEKLDPLTPTGAYRSFRPDIAGKFHSRPNRFIVRVDSSLGVLDAHCPNPGRMEELLIPGREVFLEGSPLGTSGLSRKTAWTLGGARYGNFIIPLISARASALAGELVLPRLFPELPARPEQNLGGSRIDWLIDGPTEQFWIEVKACTLVERGRAMFPDAPSSRAVRHLKELEGLTGRKKGRVLFVVMNPGAQVFSPNPHTDPVFSVALGDAISKGVDIQAISITTDDEGWSVPARFNLPVDLKAVEMAREDCGALIQLQVDTDNRTWSLVSEGHYSNLTGARNRMARKAGRATVFPIRGEMSHFNHLAEEVAGISSDLDRMESGADRTQFFMDWLLDYRHSRVFNP